MATPLGSLFGSATAPSASDAPPGTISPSRPTLMRHARTDTKRTYHYGGEDAKRDVSTTITVPYVGRRPGATAVDAGTLGVTGTPSYTGQVPICV